MVLCFFYIHLLCAWWFHLVFYTMHILYSTRLFFSESKKIQRFGTSNLWRILMHLLYIIIVHTKKKQCRMNFWANLEKMGTFCPNRLMMIVTFTLHLLKNQFIIGHSYLKSKNSLTKYLKNSKAKCVWLFLATSGLHK